jgi:hypothetical protein
MNDMPNAENAAIRCAEEDKRAQLAALMPLSAGPAGTTTLYAECQQRLGYDVVARREQEQKQKQAQAKGQLNKLLDTLKRD